MSEVWIVDDDASIRWVLQKTLEEENIAVRVFANAQDALDLLFANEPPPAVVISDIKMPALNGLRFLAVLQESYPAIAVIMITAHADLASAVDSYKGGAFDYLAKPFDIDEAVKLVHRALALELATPNDKAAKPIAKTIIGESAALQNLFKMIGRLAQTDVSVLLFGASGTGKELVASALHNNSKRADKPFVALNMAAIPKDLIESELFGYEKGAFTGANTRQLGRFEQAHGGTLFLDEIGDMPLDMQTRLLRVLSEGGFYKIGGQSLIHVDVRIIAATHQNLSELVHKGLFREDLYHRLNVIRLNVPALKERQGDVELLAQYFLRKLATEQGHSVKSFDNNALAVLNAFDWPGNVRQLENVCRYCEVMAVGDTIMCQDLPDELQAVMQGELPAMVAAQTQPQQHNSLPELSWQQLLADELAQLVASAGGTVGQGDEGFAPGDTLLKQAEKTLLVRALALSGQHKQNAALLLGWGRNTITRKLQEFDLN